MAHEFDEEESFSDRYREIKVDLAGTRQDLKNKTVSWNKRKAAGAELREVKARERQLRAEHNEERRGSEESDMIAIKKLCGLPLGYIFA